MGLRDTASHPVSLCGAGGSQSMRAPRENTQTHRHMRAAHPTHPSTPELVQHNICSEPKPDPRLAASPGATHGEGGLVPRETPPFPTVHTGPQGDPSLDPACSLRQWGVDRTLDVEPSGCETVERPVWGRGRDPQTRAAWCIKTRRRLLSGRLHPISGIPCWVWRPAAPSLTGRLTTGKPPHFHALQGARARPCSV